MQFFKRLLLPTLDEKYAIVLLVLKPRTIIRLLFTLIIYARTPISKLQNTDYHIFIHKYDYC